MLTARRWRATVARDGANDMSKAVEQRRRLVGAVWLGLAGGALAVAPGVPAMASATCPAGQVAAGGTCVSLDAAKARIDEIVREAIAKRDLKAVLAGFSVDGQPPSLFAWGSSMTGVPATPDMHFRSGAVAIAYIGTVLLQLHDKGMLGVDDKLAKWFPDYPKAEQVTLTMLINGTSGYADYVTDDSFIKQLYADPFQH
jgi:CubicO group peptidase (beta-lactamase class C family)